VRHGVDAPERARDRDVESVLADHERRFVLVEARAAVLLHAQVALRNAEHDAWLSTTRSPP
jgi:hypothetical protein